MSKSWKIHRRTVLKGLGASLALPCLNAMGDDELQKQQNIKRACFTYFGNGVSLPPKKNDAHTEIPNAFSTRKTIETRLGFET